MCKTNVYLNKSVDTAHLEPTTIDRYLCPNVRKQHQALAQQERLDRQFMAQAV